MTTALTLPSAKRTLTLLERELGGRDAIVQALVTAPQSKDVRYVLGLLGDPERQSQSLAEICLEAKILPGALLDLVKKGLTHASQVTASVIIAQGTAPMVRDVMLKAAPYEDACPKCLGSGQITPNPSELQPNPSPSDCPDCSGHGQLRYEADSECRKLGLEMAGLTAKGGGINIGISTQVAVAPQTGFSLETLQEIADRVLYGRTTPPSAIEGEVVQAPPPDPA